jgi:hypothetical protein
MMRSQGEEVEHVAKALIHGLEEAESVKPTDVERQKGKANKEPRYEQSTDYATDAQTSHQSAHTPRHSPA